MSVNLYNATTGQLTNASGGVINPKSINEMIAPIEDGTASKAYAVGEQFIMNDLLCEATQPIAQGDTMVIGTNCEESEQLSKQVKDINTSLTANGNRFEAGYSSANDEYGFNIGSTFYPIGASSGGGDGVVPLLDLDNAVILTTTAYTCTKDGAIVGGIYGGGSGVSVLVNNKTVAESASYLPVFVSGIEKGSSIRLSNNNSYTCYFAPYTYATVDPTVTVYNGVDVNFDYANPLHTFSSSNLSYTATEDCWLCGSIGEGNCIVTVNNTQIARGWYGTGYVSNDYISPLKINKGDVVSVSQVSQYLHIFKGSVVSPEVTVYNEAEVTLNYNTPLFTFNDNNLSYTAIKDCWLVGTLLGRGTSGENTVTINNNTAFKTSGGSNFITPTKIKRGDTVVTSNGSTGLYILEGTISGSVGAFKREVQRNYYFALKNGAPVDIDISSLKDTEEITITVNYAAGNSFGSERVSVSTAKTYNAHILEAQTNIGASITYANGKLQFVASHTTYSVMVWVTFN